MSNRHFQVVVVGSGFAGSLMAMIAHRLGFFTALIERGRHPRFAIGESSTPLANLLLEEIAADYDLPCIRPLAKWGTWQEQLPRLACGLKRGFTFYHHEWDRPFAPDPQRRRQLLVGASPTEEIADTHWYRPDFDHYLVQQAQALGVEFLDETILNQTTAEPNGVRLAGMRHRRPIEITAEFAVDATGPRGFLSRTLGLGEKTFDSMPATQALFSHFRGVGPLPDTFFSCGQTPPYPPEQAAVHHVFAGGWVWALKFNNGITSAGVAATDAIANGLDFKSGEPAWRRLLERLPSLKEIFGPAQAVIPFVHSPRLAFRGAEAAGSRWALLPSAAGFIDPLLSTGFALTLLGVARLARLLTSHWQRPSLRAQLEDYSKLTLLELDAAARLVGALYATMDRFDLFAHLSLLYFAAASFSETARRLGKFHLADSFLLCRHPVFAARLRQLCGAALRPPGVKQRADLRRQIREAIAPFDVAGLTDASRHPWYPALAADLLRGAPKLGASEAEVTAMLRKCALLAPGQPANPCVIS
jgi:tetracycline 7-halogenase / FADH2 O2-dependent halogenase